MSQDSASQLHEQVVDPDDYNRTQRFKEIHDARRRVTDFIVDMDIPEEGTGYFKDQSARLAHLVSLYVYELEPLIVRSEYDDGELVGEDLDYDSLLDFAAGIGMEDAETPSPSESMQIYSAANRFYAEVGMDLELDEGQGDAGFDYEDILEEGPPDRGDVPEMVEGDD